MLMLQCHQNILTSDWDSSKLTHLNDYFDEDSELPSSKYLLKCVNLVGSQRLA